MIYFNNYCTDFMFLVVMVCVTYSSKILSLIILNISLFLVEICLHVLIMEFIHKFKTKKKLKIIKDNIVDCNVMHIMISRIKNSMQ